MSISEIRRDSKLKLTGNYIKCASSSLLYFIMLSLITALQLKVTSIINNSVLLAIVQAIFLVLNWVLNYGIIANILDLTTQKTNSITDFINSTLKYGGKYLKIGLQVLLKLLVPLVFTFFSIFYWIGTKIAEINKVNFLCFYQNLVPLATCIFIFSLIILLYFIFRYILVAYIYQENKDMNEKEIVQFSKKLMHRNKINYILLLLSFLHWFLIGAIVLLILSNFIDNNQLTSFMIFFYSIIRPYIVTSKSEFYKELADIKEEKVSKFSVSKTKENKFE